MSKIDLAAREHVQAAHSKLGASSMHRWAVCPGSVKLSEGLESKSSKFAEEGTDAHELAAAELKCRMNNCHATIMELKKVEDMIIGKYGAEILTDMQAAVEVYVKYVMDIVNSYKEITVLVEHRFDLSKVHPGLFGTADCVLYIPELKLLVVIDYKHGKGIPVEVIDDHPVTGQPAGNVQLMYYGLGSLLEFKKPVEKVKLVIVQPRCNHSAGPVRAHDLSSFDMIEFSADVSDLAKRTEKPNATLLSGEHCRFCPAAGICPQLKNKANDLARVAFKPLEKYDVNELAKTYARLDEVEAWVDGVRSFAYSEAVRGVKIPGFKLVEKQSRRNWRDEGAVALAVNSLFMPETARQCFTDPELKSVAQIEKQLGKEDFKSLEAHVVKTSSGTTLAPLHDKRPEVATDAKSVFDKAAEAAALDIFS